MQQPDRDEGAARGKTAGSQTPRPFVLGLAVGALAAAVFSASLGGGWIYDDGPLIANNVYVRSFAFWQRWVTHDFWDVNEELKIFKHRMVYWRPGITASYATDWALGNGSPVVFHATNLVWHTIASILAFVLLRRWLGTAWPAFFGALLFALHPTKAESVAWIAGRTDVLCAAAMLLAAQGMAMRMRGLRRGWAVEGVATVAAYLFKEQAVVLAGFAFVETWVVLGRPALRRKDVLRMASATAPQLTLAVAFLTVRHWLLPIKTASSGMRLGDHTCEVLESLGRYFELTLFPHDLSVQQGLLRTQDGRLLFSPAYIVAGAVGIVALAAVAWSLRTKRPAIALGIAFYGAMMLPTSNIVTTDMVTMISERFLYLPMLGAALAAGGAMAWLASQSPKRARIAIAAAGAVVVLFAVGSWRRASDFVDETEFWERELALHPDSLEALRFKIARAASQKNFTQALELATQGQSVAARYYAHAAYELDFVLQGLELVLCTTPDRDAKTLRTVDRFFEVLLDPHAEVAELDLDARSVDLTLRMPLQRPALARRVGTQRARILGLRAGIHSRIGRDVTALEFALAAHGMCPGCYEIGRMAALVAGRAQQYRQANAILDTVALWTTEATVTPMRRTLRDAERASKLAASAQDEPSALHLRATELATLEAWGRAFEVLARAKDAIKEAPAFAIGFAELAWRAGEFMIAREVLSTMMAPEAASQLTEQWSQKMGWSNTQRL